MTTPFRERNPVTIGVAGLVAIGVLMLAAFKASRTRLRALFTCSTRSRTFL